LLELYNAVAITYKQTQQNTEDIKELKAENEKLKAENKEMRKEIDKIKRVVFVKEEKNEVTVL
jgi:cell division protein FtsB